MLARLVTKAACTSETQEPTQTLCGPGKSPQTALRKALDTAAQPNSGVNISERVISDLECDSWLKK
jgi:hypothetical protein